MEYQAVERQPGDSVRDFVYRFLKQNIISTRLQPGVMICEKEITDLLEVSRTPLREACMKLAAEDLIDIVPQKGTYVSFIDPGLIDECMFMRESLEVAAARLACTCLTGESLLKLKTNLQMQAFYIAEGDEDKWFELDREMHRLIFVGCGKQKVWEYVHQMNARIDRIRVLSFCANRDGDQVVEQHTEIIHAIEAKDVGRAEAVMRRHVRKIQPDTLGVYAKFPHFFSSQPVNLAVPIGE
jgi:DNA-binding GntR family transcriptional regulator